MDEQCLAAVISQSKELAYPQRIEQVVLLSRRIANTSSIHEEWLWTPKGPSSPDDYDK